MNGRPEHTVTIGLVGCGKAKLDRPAAAARLYTGSWFTKAARYAAQAYDYWWILSAEHHLVDPCEILDPYDTPMPRARPAATRWAITVEQQLRRRTPLRAPQLSVDELKATYPYLSFTVYLHAGRDYCGPLLELLTWSTTYTPLAGLGIGHQNRWHNQHYEQTRKRRRGWQHTPLAWRLDPSSPRGRPA